MNQPFRSLAHPETLARLVRRLPAGVYITNEHGRILDANPACLALFGVASIEELQRFDVSELFVNPSQRSQQLAVLENTSSLRQYELSLRRPDGEIRTVIDTCYSVTDPDSQETLYHGILIDITDRKNLEEQLRELTVHDPLTGCFNRRQLQIVEEQADQEVTMEDSLWGCILIDVDRFKDYNDRHGHDAGDRVLQRVAHFLQSQVGKNDPVVRIGGDEFLIIITGAAARQTDRIAQHLYTGSAPVPISIGWAVRRAGERLEATIHRADHRLLERRRLDRSQTV